MADQSARPIENRYVVESATEDAVTPEAELAAATASRPAKNVLTAGSVQWVRTADALAAVSGRAAGRGIDLHRELAHRARTASTAALPALTSRAKRIAPMLRTAIPTRQSLQLGRSR